VAYNDADIRIIQHEIAMAKERLITMGTAASDTDAMANVRVTFDGSGQSVPVKAFRGVNVRDGDRVGLIKFGADWIVVNSYGGGNGAAYATTADRDLAIPNPTVGMTCSVAETGEIYVYRGTWVGLVPRVIDGRFASPNDQHVTDSVTLEASNWCTMPLEAESTYVVEGMICYFSTGVTTNGYKCGWSVPAGVIGEWNSLGLDFAAPTVHHNVDQFWTLTFSHAVATSTGRFTRVGGVLNTVATAGDLTWMFAEDTAVGGVTSVVTRGVNSWLRVHKVR
jgi:hypothetical protein